MKNQHWGPVPSIVQFSALLAAFSFAISGKFPFARYYALGVLASTVHFAMLFNGIKKGASAYITRSFFLLASIFWAFYYMEENFWYFLFGLFTVKAIIIFGYIFSIARGDKK